MNCFPSTHQLWISLDWQLWSGNPRCLSEGQSYENSNRVTFSKRSWISGGETTAKLKTFPDGGRINHIRSITPYTCSYSHRSDGNLCVEQNLGSEVRRFLASNANDPPPSCKTHLYLLMLFLSSLLWFVLRACFLNCQNVVLFYSPEPNRGSLKNSWEADTRVNWPLSTHTCPPPQKNTDSAIAMGNGLPLSELILCPWGLLEKLSS